METDIPPQQGKKMRARTDENRHLTRKIVCWKFKQANTTSWPRLLGAGGEMFATIAPVPSSQIREHFHACRRGNPRRGAASTRVCKIPVV